MAPVAIGVAGLGASAVLAEVGGVSPMNVSRLLAFAAAGAVLAGLAAAAVLRLSRRRGLALQTAVVALAPVVAVAIAVGLAAWSMFIMAHDVLIVAVVLVAAGSLALIVALLLARRLVRSSRQLAELARRIAEADDRSEPDVDSAGGPGELAALARELAVTSERLRQARRLAEDTERTRRELVAWVSHDLRTPLAGIRAMAEALADGVVDDRETVARYHTTMGLEAERLAGLVNDLFELSRIQAGALRLAVEPVPVAELVSDLVEASRPASGAVELVSWVPEHLVVELSGPEMLRVLRNLVDNALRHTPAGGQVSVTAGQDETTAWIAVSDGCGGIPEELLAHVFEPGWRGDSARTAGDRRSGLGLAVARGLVEAHGGRLEVRNTGAGCEFTIRLPAGPATTPLKARPQPGPARERA